MTTLNQEKFRAALIAELQRNWPELSAMHEDLAQEGLLRALQIDRDDVPVSYYLTSARRRWARLVAGREPWTGSEGSQHTYRARTYTDGDILATADRPSDDVPPDLDVRAAVAALPPSDRRLVWLRFWEGYDWPEVAQVEGMARNTPQNRWTKYVRPALRERLNPMLAATP